MVESDALLFVMIETAQTLRKDVVFTCAPGFDFGRDAERVDLPRRGVLVLSDSSAKQRDREGRASARMSERRPVIRGKLSTEENTERICKTLLTVCSCAVHPFAGGRIPATTSPL